MESDDRPCYELREERDVEGEVDGALQVTRGAPEEIDQVAERVERIERDPDRQDHPSPVERCPSERPEHAIDLIDGEVRVLEPAEQPNIQDDRRRQRDHRTTPVARQRPTFDRMAEEVVRRDGAHEGEDQGPVPHV